MQLVTLEQARDHLHVDTADGDNDLLLKIKGASRAVMRYVNANTDGWTDSAGDPLEDSGGIAINVPEDILAATLFLVGFLDRNRDADLDKAFQLGWLPAPVIALLTTYHDPTFA